MLALYSFVAVIASCVHASESLQGSGVVGVYPIPPSPDSSPNPVSFQDLLTKKLPADAEKLGREGNEHGDSEHDGKATKFLRSNDVKPLAMETSAMKTEACASPNVLVRGSGPVLSAPIIYPIFWGTAYWGSAAGSALKTSILTMMRDMVASTAFTNPINQYDNLNPGTIFPGGSYGIVYDESTSVTQATIEYDLNWWLNHYTFPGTGQGNYIYAIYFQPATTISAFGQTSCTNFCGFHGHGQVGSHRYIVMPYLGPLVPGVGGGGCYAGCHFSNTNYNYANVFAHELAETMTDPDLSNWRAPAASGNEVGDICNAQWVFQTVPSPPGNCAGTTATYLYQKEWSNSACACV